MVKASQTVLAYTKAPVSSADTEITIRGLNDIYGNQAVMQGDLMYGTLEPRSSTNQEIISFTHMVVVDANTVRLTGCTRGLKAQDSETGTARDHGANVEFILSNNPQFYDTFAALDEAETITAAWDFNVSPTVPTPTADEDAVNKDYADTLAILGSPDASTTVKGISRLSASPSTSIGTFTVTIASPAVFTCASHGLTENDSVQLTTDGALPTGLAASTTYYVIAAGLTSSEFRLSATYGGSAINTSGTQSGTHTLFKTTPVAVGVNDTKMLTQDENNAAAGAGGYPSSTNKYETQYDTSNASTKTATTISFAAGTKTIADSGNGFVVANFKAGTQITVTGSASNNGTYTIVSVAAGAIVVAETLVNESAGASVTITSVTADKLVRYNAAGGIPGSIPATDVQTFTGNGTWTKPSGAKSVLVQMWGAGGGGAGGGANTGGGGGGGGGYIEYTFNASDLSATEDIVVGLGAAATLGGNSSFGTTKLIAYGGAAGLAAGSQGSGGGGAGIASVGSAGSGTTGGAGGDLAGGAGSAGGAGGASLLGGGAGGGGANTGLVGGRTAQGGGGGGGGAINGGAPGAGGAGGASIYGGGGGGGGGGTAGGAGGASTKGGAGGAGVTGTNNGNPGVVPAGGGGGGAGVASTGGAGARGQVVVTTYF